MNKIVFWLILVGATQIYAHPGGLDANGGHTDRKSGEYHCHRSPCGGSKNNNPSTYNRTKSYGTTSPAQSIKIVRFQTCTEVIDGDTIVLNNTEKVRLIGVDTPETKHPQKPVEYFGKEASAFTKKILEGKTVRVEYDQEAKDKYGRTLAYVYLEDGTFLNAEIIKQGYGHAYTKFPFKYLEEFRQYEREARENKRGLWGLE